MSFSFGPTVRSSVHLERRQDKIGFHSVVTRLTRAPPIGSVAAGNAIASAASHRWQRVKEMDENRSDQLDKELGEALAARWLVGERSCDNRISPSVCCANSVCQTVKLVALCEWRICLATHTHTLNCLSIDKLEIGQDSWRLVCRVLVAERCLN